MYMSGSLMGMRYDAPVLYKHVMSYKEKINEEHSEMIEQITSPRERAKKKAFIPTDRFFFPTYTAASGIGMSIADQARTMASDVVGGGGIGATPMGGDSDENDHDEDDETDSEEEYRTTDRKNAGANKLIIDQDYKTLDSIIKNLSKALKDINKRMGENKAKKILNQMFNKNIEDTIKKRKEMRDKRKASSEQMTFHFSTFDEWQA